MDEPEVTLLEAEWTALLDLGASFSDADWNTPTELPGWTVKDCFSHVVGIERSLQGEQAPPIDLADYPHLTSLSAAVTEPPVQARRHLPGVEILEELAAVTRERLAELRSLPVDRWDEIVPTPVGTRPYREFMHVRIFDCWMHEQDVRRALGRPGHQDGPVAEQGMDRCSQALGFIVGKKAAAPEGTVVVFDITGGLARQFVVAVASGRAALVDEAPDEPTVTLTLDQETLWCLGGGRWDPDAVLADGRVSITGDRALGEAVVRATNFMI